MSLLNEQRKRNQTMQQVKELARAGQWQEAKKLVDTLPDTPDVIRIRNSIEKQLYIATGEIPAVMEGTPVVADTDEDLTSWVTSPSALKTKRTVGDIPSYMPIRIAGYLIYGVGVMAMTGSVLLFLISFTEASYYGDATRANAFVSFVGGFSAVASGGMIFMFIDIARNTFITNQLLARLLDKSSEQ
jgi:hypothetical protein